MQQLVKRLFAGLVERCRGFIEEEKVRLEQKCASEAQTFLFTEG